MIEVSNLTKKYGDHKAVDNLSFTIEDGKITGFLGPNGAGKSTTMNMMTGFIAPTSGKVLINGVDILKDPEGAKRQIGYLPELPPVYNDMTVREYLSFVAELKMVPKKERNSQIEEVEELTTIKDVDNRLIRNLSKGYRQRVGFAQAIIGFPPIIILDEPMVGLDPKQIIEIRDLIKKLGEKHTVILSSHILSEISMVCDRIMIISKGRLVAFDTPENLISQNTDSTEYDLTVSGLRDQTLEVLASLGEPGYEIKENEDSLSIKISSKEEHFAEKLFFAFADARIPITELKHSTHSLEDIFLELTDSAAAVNETAENNEAIIAEADEQIAASEENAADEEQASENKEVQE